MKTERIEITDKQKWLELRTKNINSTESSALFGLNKWTTEFEIFFQKQSGAIVSIEETERMKIGSKIEATIAQIAAEERGWNIRPRKFYEQIPELRTAASYDFELINSSGTSEALIECKNVDAMVARNEWEVDEDGIIEPPPQISLQCQHQLLVSGLPTLYLVALWGGNSLKIIEMERDESVIKAIKDRIKKFWDRVDSNTPPSPDFERDASFIAKLMKHSEPGKIVEADETISHLMNEYRAASDAEKQASMIKEACKARVLMQVNDAEKVIGADFSISMKEVKPTIVESYEKKGYRSFRPYFNKEKT